MLMCTIEGRFALSASTIADAADGVLANLAWLAVLLWFGAFTAAPASP